MTTRTEKVASLIQQIVAAFLPELLEKAAVGVTVTGVDVSPDMRNATVWVSVLDAMKQDITLGVIEASRREFQRQVASRMTTKFVPRLSFKLDAGGQYADHINRLLHKLE